MKKLSLLSIATLALLLYTPECLAKKKLHTARIINNCAYAVTLDLTNVYSKKNKTNKTTITVPATPTQSQSTSGNGQQNPRANTSSANTSSWKYQGGFKTVKATNNTTTPANSSERNWDSKYKKRIRGKMITITNDANHPGLPQFTTDVDGLSTTPPTPPTPATPPTH